MYKLRLFRQTNPVSSATKGGVTVEQKNNQKNNQNNNQNNDQRKENKQR